jgi:hypothetical protein
MPLLALPRSFACLLGLSSVEVVADRQRDPLLRPGYVVVISDISYCLV